MLSPPVWDVHRELYCLLSLFWGLGVAATLIRWLVRRLRFRLALRAGFEITGGREAVAFNQARSWLFPHREIKLVAFRAAGSGRLARLAANRPGDGRPGGTIKRPGIGLS